MFPVVLIHLFIVTKANWALTNTRCKQHYNIDQYMRDKCTIPCVTMWHVLRSNTIIGD